ncbi:LpxI family protein [Tepidamorphus sp. 3E244]|uniref:LpxI family protein n=1 Tax=Tepidamorphus sp. 3E244 TaxID=3385498 RepID=UPI0038FC6EC0
MSGQGTGGGRIALYSGEGELPSYLAEEGRATGVDLVVYGIDGLYAQNLKPDAVFGLGEVGRMKRQMKADKVERVVFSGRFYRPDYAAVAWDAGGVAMLPKILKTRIGGDDSTSRAISSIVDSWGLSLAGPLDIAPSFAATSGALSRKKPTRVQSEDIAFGFDVVAGLGAFDIGQAIIVHDRRILAVEAAEGTDLMIERISTLRANGRLRVKVPSGILVKTAKPGQEMRMDMPVIGSDTVRKAAESGLAGIAIAAGEVLLATPNAVREEAERAGIFVAGIARDAV